MKTVELKTAYHWNCEECGADNFSVGMKAEFGPGEREESFREFHDMASYEELPENWEKFEMVCIPETVTCKECKAKFSAVNEVENREEP